MNFIKSKLWVTKSHRIIIPLTEKMSCSPCLFSGHHDFGIMSAEVAVQKFSLPFSCTALLSQANEVTQKACIQVKPLEHHGLQVTPVLNTQNPIAIKAIVHNESQAQENPTPALGGDVASLLLQTKLVSAELTKSAVLSGRSVFEKLIVESEDQRPVAKRQLSSESASRTIAVVKKSAVRKEVEEHRHLKPKSQLGQRAAPGKRRRRKDLFSSSEVFHTVDAQALKAGAQVGKR